MDVRGKTIVAEHVWLDGRVQEHIAISVDASGVIRAIGEMPNGEEVIKTANLLVPGFVNTHSHAFHRFLRGKSEIGKSAADTFWKWRDNMYGLVAEVDKHRIYEYCLTTFKEMLNAGITTVGEFHYVHHSDNKFDLDESVIQAAIDAGIRIVLLQTLYERAGFDNAELHPVQNRFVSSYQEFIENLKKLRKSTTHERVRIGVAAHSARAVPFENIKKLFDYATAEQIPFHIHLEEQPKEIVDCQKSLASKKGPSDVLLADIGINEYFTAVHATYTPAANMVQFAKLGGNVSICPCTEGYLGDGIPRINEELSISFGTDCNNRISFLEEMRWACYSQQMLHNSRSVCGLSAEKLLNCATINGAKSLNIGDQVGTFEIGKYFDAVVFDSSTSPALSTSRSETLIDSLVFSCGNREISNVFVAGVDPRTN
ncbi:unnamed protein product [Caenorhabditis bovis]|uniref:Amidohydrolase-related domain-containing protein n=1 Tax=Caenorhabditis bovis TaxID=2654633 RepID=A0A8S1FCG5_9PELO|nr:unnamed protein product [Caenorhabditis bovis]